MQVDTSVNSATTRTPWRGISLLSGAGVKRRARPIRFGLRNCRKTFWSRSDSNVGPSTNGSKRLVNSDQQFDRRVQTRRKTATVTVLVYRQLSRPRGNFSRFVSQKIALMGTSSSFSNGHPTATIGKILQSISLCSANWKRSLKVTRGLIITISKIKRGNRRLKLSTEMLSSRTNTGSSC
jgi:hypothetical protein